MKKIFVLFMAVVSFQGNAKELPALDEMIQAISANKLTHIESDKWQELKEKQYSQTFDQGSLVIDSGNIYQLLSITGKNSDELLLSFSIAALQCVQIPMIAIDQENNKTLQNLMIRNASQSLRAPGKVSHTIAFGYNFDVTATPGNGGILLSCLFG